MKFILGKVVLLLMALTLIAPLGAGSVRAANWMDSIEGDTQSSAPASSGSSFVSSSGSDSSSNSDSGSGGWMDKIKADNDVDVQKEVHEPEEWELFFNMDNQLFPSTIISLSTIRDPSLLGMVELDDSFGSPLAMASVYIIGRAGDEVTVEISSTKLIKPSRMTVTLPESNRAYRISPHLKYEYEKMLSIHQPYPEDITAKVYLNGEFLGEKSKTIIVRSINDCFYGQYVETEDGSVFQPWPEMFVAYVNEGHPVVDQILAEALKKGYVDSFIGYQGEQQDVVNQVHAIWRVLKDRGIKYSSITTTSVESDKIAAQHVRMVGDSIEGSQANCVDGSVLMASVFRKLGLDAYLVLLPGHMMVGASVDSEGSSALFLETTMLSGSSMNDAMRSADETIDKHRAPDGGAGDVTYINVSGSRSVGILPLREID